MTYQSDILAGAELGALPQETVIYKWGNYWEIVEREFSNGSKERLARRPPGVRIIVPTKDNQGIWMIPQDRGEGMKLDLPGGKVFDSTGEWELFRRHCLEWGTSLAEATRAQATIEAAQEMGIAIHQLEPIAMLPADKSVINRRFNLPVEWDLYYFIAQSYDWLPEGQSLCPGEKIGSPQKVSYDRLEGVIRHEMMNNERSKNVLRNWAEVQRQSNGRTVL